MPSATIKIFLIYGDPKRLRTAELSNWNGKAVAGPRNEFDEILKREESVNPGIYLLSGIDPESDKPALYIGEAECIKDRLKSHSHLEKDYWNQIVFFTSKDENLTKSHIRFLEGKLIDLAEATQRSILMNNQKSGAKLPESDREDMEVFLEKINQLLPVLGIDLLVPQVMISQKGNGNEKLFCEIKGLKATGQRTANGFVVFKGSQAVLQERASTQKYPSIGNLRQRLKNDEVLVEQNDHLLFTQDKEFSSPSTAGNVIHGGNTNGLVVWKDKDGRSLKEIESSSVE
jgi:hypothetical protein